MQDAQPGCPVAQDRDDRKTAEIAKYRVKPPGGTRPVGSFSLARAILRSPDLKQAGMSGAALALDNPEQAPVFFLDGEPHRRKRATISRFFTPKAIETRHQRVMEASTDALLAEFKARGTASLDQMAWSLAVDVAGEIVGLTIGLSPAQKAALAKRIEAIMDRTQLSVLTGLRRRIMEVWYAGRVLQFHFGNVRPAIKARRKAPQEDIITHLIAEGYSDKAILIECMTYAGAGMVTTREFIVMAAWHLFDHPDLRARFLAGGKDEQTAILEEILRLEPVATLLYRSSEGAPAARLPEALEPNQTYAIDMRQANTDEAAVGACPYALDPGRAARIKASGAYLSFGDGSHRCPGAQVALSETRIFIDRLLRIPGIRLAAPPRIRWNDALMSYELRKARVTCDRQ